MTKPKLKLTKYLWEITVINKRTKDEKTFHAMSVGVGNLIYRAKQYLRKEWKCDLKEIEVIRAERGYKMDF